MTYTAKCEYVQNCEAQNWKRSCTGSDDSQQHLFSSELPEIRALWLCVRRKGEVTRDVSLAISDCRPDLITQHAELTDKRMELSKIHDGPHEVAADECECDACADETGRVRKYLHDGLDPLLLVKWLQAVFHTHT